MPDGPDGEVRVDLTKETEVDPLMQLAPVKCSPSRRKTSSQDGQPCGIFAHEVATVASPQN